MTSQELNMKSGGVLQSPEFCRHWEITAYISVFLSQKKFSHPSYKIDAKSQVKHSFFWTQLFVVTKHIICYLSINFSLNWTIFQCKFYKSLFYPFSGYTDLYFGSRRCFVSSPQFFKDFPISAELHDGYTIIFGCYGNERSATVISDDNSVYVIMIGLDDASWWRQVQGTPIRFFRNMVQVYKSWNNTFFLVMQQWLNRIK